MRSFSRCILALAVLASPAAAQHAGSVTKLSWIGGCWQRTARNGQIIDEQWMAPKAEVMMGMSRTVRGDSLIEYEQLRIFERAGRAIYHAVPVRQAPTEFTAASVSDTLVVFENPQHDFPQRVIYRKRGADSLIARIEGTANGTARGIDFPYAKARCPGS